jgi:hypothetical protein
MYTHRKGMDIFKEEIKMWSKGIIEIDGTKVSYEVKHFEEGSDFGIGGGRISKLVCLANEKTILHYERGWNKKPQTKLGKKAYKILKKKYN